MGSVAPTSREAHMTSLKEGSELASEWSPGQLQTGRLLPGAHPENHSPIAAGRSATPTVLWKARNKEGFSFLPFSNFSLPERK